MARQAVRRLRFADREAKREAAESARIEAAEFRLRLKAEREAIRLRIIPGMRRLEDTRQEKELFVREKQHEAGEQAGQLRERWRAIETILTEALAERRTVFLEDLRLTNAPLLLPPPPELVEPTARPPLGLRPEREERAWSLAALMPLGRGRWAEAEDEPVRLARLAAEHEWAERERRRLENLTAWEVAQESHHESFLTKQLWRNREIEAMGREIEAGDAEAIAVYVALTLERSLYPEGFPDAFEIGFDADTGLLIVEAELPDVDIVPRETDVQYIQSSNQIVPVPMRGIDRKFVYQNLLGRIALRSLHEIFGATDGLPVRAVVYNGFVRAKSGGTPADRKCVVSILTNAAEFARADLRDSDPRAALRPLGALLSRPTDEDPAVTPLVALPLAAASGPDADDPAAFDILLSDLLRTLGFRSIHRHGSDAALRFVAFDEHPVLGGKVLIGGLPNAGLVGVEIVNAFLDSFAASGAVRGILMAKGGFDLPALERAQTQPIELIDGYGLALLARLGPEPESDDADRD
ncbi:restriction endonuclease [Kaistia algarum]|uniref:restriction endonuclease n=1 Tax=Kaistia algarum TaxID=2083279 RepID=UPI00224C95C7|nr:restriction endonuclease [Kaistia algarum]MCX5515903.1 restriction endonuclease [Kaistia algarum]